MICQKNINLLNLIALQTLLKTLLNGAGILPALFFYRCLGLLELFQNVHNIADCRLVSRCIFCYDKEKIIE